MLMICRGTAWLVSLAVGAASAVLIFGASTGYATSSVRIDSPTDGARVSGMVEVRATVRSDDPSQFDFARVYVGRGREPVTTRPAGPPTTRPVENAVIAQLDTNLLTPGDAFIEVRAYDKNGELATASIVVVIEAGVTQPVTFSGPRVEVPYIPVVTAPAGASTPLVELPVPVLPDLSLSSPESPSRIAAPIQPLSPNLLLDSLPTDPVQVDPMLDGIQLAPVLPPPPYLPPIPRT
jgi:hypothetical protein